MIPAIVRKTSGAELATTMSRIRGIDPDGELTADGWNEAMGLKRLLELGVGPLAVHRSGADQGAIIVQELVRPHTAGIACGRWGGSRGIVIEAAQVSGKSPARGIITTEVVEVYPVGDEWDVRYRRQAHTVGASFVDHGAPRGTPAEGGPRCPVLSRATAREIAETVAELQWEMGRPLHLEWAQSEGKIWWLRMRPRSRAPRW